MDIFRRPLLPCVLSYILGLWLVHEIAHVWPLAAWGVGLGVGAAAGWMAWRRRDVAWLLLVLLMLGGAMVMGVREREQVRAERIVAELDSELPRVIWGSVRGSVAAQLEDGLRLEIDDVWVTSGTAEVFLPGRMTLFAEAAHFRGGVVPSPGERISFLGYVSGPRFLRNFFGYDRAEALRHRQIYSMGRPLAVREVAVLDVGSKGVRGDVHRVLMNFREEVSEVLARYLSGREGRFMRAMLFNDMGALQSTEKGVFRESGTLHLFAVSGLHVAILGGLLNLLFRAMRFGLRGAWVWTVFVMFLYLWMVDFVPSATRAYLMLAAITVGQVLGREVDSLSSLVLAVAVIVGFDPAAVWDAGLLLSVAGVLGIIMVGPLLRLWFGPAEVEMGDWRQRVLSSVADAVYVGLGVTVALLPLQVWYFGFWNVLSVPANVVLAGMSGLVLSAGLLTAGLAFFWEGGAQACGATASLLMRVLYFIADVTARSDWAMVHFRRVPAWLLFGVVGVLMGGYYFVFRSTPEFSLKSRARFACHGLCAVGLLVGFQFYDRLGVRDLEIWVFDVGQGDATLVRFPDRSTMLIDGGRSEPDMGAMVVVPQLRGLGIKRLDYVVATHDDDDHTGGLAEVVRSVGARVLMVPTGFRGGSASSSALLAAAREHGCVVQYMAAGDGAEAGGCRVMVLNPPEGHSIREDNEMSLAFGIEFGGFRALLMGDAGLLTEARLMNEWRNVGGGFEDVTFLRLGHHGSGTSSGEEFLGFTRPLVALASCGLDNQFGHPAPDVRMRLEGIGTRILRTDMDGAVLVRSDGRKFTVRRAGQGD